MIDGLNMNDLLQKAKEMQENFSKKKEEAAQKTIDVEVAAGMVKLTMNGNMDLLSINIDPEIVDKNDVSTLEDLVRSAVNEGVRQARELGTSGIADMVSNFNLQDLGKLNQ
jgi:nucleoid-associated protein EbfC